MTQKFAPGFTLFEVLVVLAIIALISAVTVGVYPSLSPTIQARGAVGELAAGLRHARSQAMTLNKEVRLLVDVRNGSFKVGEAGRARKLPESLGISLYTAESELIDAQIGSIRFFPDGSSTGGRISLENGTNSYNVVVDWFTGNVSIAE
jgi:general secretion pathway protein H